jgi:hypothetical protein
MHDRKRVRAPSSAPLRLRGDQHVAFDVAQQRAHILVVELEQIVEDEHRLLDRPGDVAIQLGELGHHLLFGDLAHARHDLRRLARAAHLDAGDATRLARMALKQRCQRRERLGRHRSQLGDAAQHLRLNCLGQHLQHLPRGRGFEMREQHRGDLGMFLLEHRRDLGRVHPLQRGDRLIRFGRQDARQDRARTLRTERLGDDRFELGTRIELDRAALLRAAGKVVQDLRHFPFADIGDAHHRGAELTDFLGIELLEDRGGLFVADDHHQHRGALDAGKVAGRIHLSCFPP